MGFITTVKLVCCRVSQGCLQRRGLAFNRRLKVRDGWSLGLFKAMVLYSICFGSMIIFLLLIAFPEWNVFKTAQSCYRWLNIGRISFTAARVVIFVVILWVRNPLFRSAEKLIAFSPRKWFIHSVDELLSASKACVDVDSPYSAGIISASAIHVNHGNWARHRR